MKQVFIARDLLEAQFIKNCLVQDGIESVIQGEFLSGVWGAVPIAPETSPSVWVVDDCDFEKAKDYIEKLEQYSPDPPAADWKCEKCGEILGSNFTDCWRCALTPDVEPAEISLDDSDSASLDNDLPPAPSSTENSLEACTGVVASHRTNRDLWEETSLVILVCVATYGYHALAILIWPDEYQFKSSLYHSLSYLMGGAVDIALVSYLICRSGESWSQFGLVHPKWLMDVLLGCALWMAAWAICSASWRLIDGLFGPDFFKSENRERSPFVPIPVGVITACVFVISVCVSAFAEEFVFRAYLFSRLERLLGSGARSILLTTGLFASYHIYQGIGGTISAFIMGLVYGLGFFWWRRLWPVALAHAIGNLLLYWSEFAERV